MNTTLISTSEETEKNGHELGTLHLKVACLPIPPYAQQGENKGLTGQMKVKNGLSLTVCLTGNEKQKCRPVFELAARPDQLIRRSHRNN